MNLCFVGKINATGIGRHTGGVFRALQPRMPPGCSLHYIDFEMPESMQAWMQHLSGPSDVAVFCWRFDPAFLAQFACRKIGWLFFESDKLAPSWVEQMQAFDELWMPSEWARDRLVDHGIPADRIQVVGCGIDPVLYQPGREEHEGFVFLMVGKYERRKGVDEAIEAFVRAFPPEGGERVELWLKVDHPGFPDRIAALAQRWSADPRIRFVQPGLEDAQMAWLYRRADAFVYPTRAEGFGLPTLEAIACGLPVITTRYSAQTTFLDHIPGLFFEVDYRVGEIVDPDHDHYYGRDFAGGGYGNWALPDVGSVARGMRDVYAQIGPWRERAARASAVVRGRFSWEQIATDVLERVAPRESGYIPHPDSLRRST